MLKAHSGIKRLEEYAEVVCGPFGSAITLEDYAPSGVPLLRISNITDDGRIDERNLAYLSVAKAAELERTQVEPGDLVVSQRGTLGAPAVVPATYSRWCISANLIAIKRPNLRPHFVQAFMSARPGALQLKRAQSGQVQGKITTADVAKLLIPRLASERRLLAALDAARVARRKKITEANAILAGLSDFILNALGLTLPPPDDHMVYGIRLSDAERQRLDVHFYQPYLRDVERRVRQARIGMTPLRELLAAPPINGVDARDFSETGRRYLRVQNIRPFEIVADEVKHVLGEHRKDVALRPDDILLTRKGTFGVAAVVKQNETDCLISSEIMLLRLNPEIHIAADFLVAWINSGAGRTLLDRHKTGGIMGHLTQDVVSEFPVPLVTKEVQEQIMVGVARRRAQERRLRDEARTIWNDAKRRFEDELLRPATTAEASQTLGAKGGTAR